MIEETKRKRVRSKPLSPQALEANRRNAQQPRGGQGLVLYTLKVRPALLDWLKTLTPDQQRNILEKACSDGMVI